MALIDELVQKITVKADTKAIDVVQKKEQKLIATTNTLSDSLKSAFKWIGGGLLLKSIFNATVQLDSMERSFNTLAGSAEKGAEEIHFLRMEAERLGQSFPSIAQAYKGLFATGIGANMDRNIIRGVFSGVLEASAVLGTTEQETESAIIALQQMLSKGKVMTQELRLQLGNALPGAFQIAAKAMGVSTAELEKMVSKGLDAKEFLQKFGDELHIQFGGKKLENSIHSIRAEWTRFQNALFDTKTGIFAGDTGNTLAELIKGLTEVITSEGFRLALKGVANALNVIMKNMRLILYYLGLYKAMKLLNELKLLKIAIVAFNNELALSGSLSMAIGSGFKATLKYLSLMMSGSLTFAKNVAVALSVLLLAEDLVASLIPGSKTTTKRAGSSLGGALSETQNESIWKGLGRNLVMMAGGAIGTLFAPDAGKSYWGETEITIPQQIPNVTINQNIATGASPDEIAERTKQTLTGMFAQYSMGGVK